MLKAASTSAKTTAGISRLTFLTARFDGQFPPPRLPLLFVFTCVGPSGGIQTPLARPSMLWFWVVVRCVWDGARCIAVASVPLVVNTHGWVKGLGLTLVEHIHRTVRPAWTVRFPMEFCVWLFLPLSLSLPLSVSLSHSLCKCVCVCVFVHVLTRTLDSVLNGHRCKSVLPPRRSAPVLASAIFTISMKSRRWN